MTDGNDKDPLVAGLRSAVVHLSKAGFEVLAAVGDVVGGVRERMTGSDDDPDDGGSTREHVTID